MAGLEFTKLMKQFGDRLQINLEPGSNDSCSVALPDGCELLFYESPSKRYLVVVSFIGELDAGPFRVNALRAAMQANHTLPPRYGTFGFSRNHNKLMIWESYELATVSAEQLLDDLAEFSFKVATWGDALRRNTVPDIQVEGEPKKASEGGPGLFGLRP